MPWGPRRGSSCGVPHQGSSGGALVLCNWLMSGIWGSSSPASAWLPCPIPWPRLGLGPSAVSLTLLLWVNLAAAVWTTAAGMRGPSASPLHTLLPGGLYPPLLAGGAPRSTAMTAPRGNDSLSALCPSLLSGVGRGELMSPRSRPGPSQLRPLGDSAPRRPRSSLIFPRCPRQPCPQPQLIGGVGP